MTKRWPIAKLRGLTRKIGSGATPRGGDEVYKTSGVPLIRSMNVHFAGFKEEGLVYLDDQEAKKLDHVKVEANDVLLNITGASIGRVTTTPESMAGARVNQHVCIIRPNPELCPRFLAQFLASPDQQRKVMNVQVGVTRQALTKAMVLDWEIPLPPLDEQRQLVAEIEKQFSRLDEAAANLKRVNANLKRYKAAVLKAAVEGKLTEEWRKAHPDIEPASELLKRILAERRAKWKEKGKYKEPAAPVTTSLPLLPEGWTWATVDQLTADALIGMDRGRAQQSESPLGVPYIKMNNVTMDGRLVLEGLVYVAASADERNRYAIKCGDLLFNTRNSKELVGKVALVRNIPPNAIYNNNLVRIRVRAEVLPEFVCFQMCADGFRRRMELIKRATTNVAAVYGKDLFPLPIALPPLVEQHRIVAEAEQRLSVIGKLEAAVASNFQRADRLRQSVLREAFSGTLKLEMGTGWFFNQSQPRHLL